MATDQRGTSFSGAWKISIVRCVTLKNPAFRRAVQICTGRNGRTPQRLEGLKAVAKWVGEFERLKFLAFPCSTPPLAWRVPFLNPRLAAFYGGLARALMNLRPARLLLAMPNNTAPNRLNATDFSSDAKLPRMGGSLLRIVAFPRSVQYCTGRSA